jgi:hypothetical protein
MVLNLAFGIVGTTYENYQSRVSFVLICYLLMFSSVWNLSNFRGILAAHHAAGYSWTK